MIAIVSSTIDYLFSETPESLYVRISTYIIERLQYSRALEYSLISQLQILDSLIESTNKTVSLYKSPKKFLTNFYQIYSEHVELIYERCDKRNDLYSTKEGKLEDLSGEQTRPKPMNKVVWKLCGQYVNIEVVQII